MSRIHTTDLIGKQFNHLFVLGIVHRGRRCYLRCKCRCGTLKDIRSDSVTSNDIVSCGCYAREASSKRFHKHGISETRTHRIWRGIHQRCHNENNPDYPRYGGRGIVVCERWGEFLNFLADMGECPGKMTLDRKDNNGPYSKDNCRWVTRAEQARNRSDNRQITHDGRTMVLMDWAIEFGVKFCTLDGRIRRMGVERAFAKSSRTVAPKS